MKPSRSELRFASLLTYSPREPSHEARRSRAWIPLLKEGRILRTDRGEFTAAAYVSRRLRELELSFLAEFIGPEAVLVPVPRSALLVRGGFWPASEIAEALVTERLGARALRALVRERPVTKAATSVAANRPKARDHYDSLEVREPLELPSRITLVDDVVTRGAQLLGAAWRIWKARPDIEVRAFAVIRTMSDVGSFKALLAPCEGWIRFEQQRCVRRP